jgi:hypothetical protein
LEIDNPDVFNFFLTRIQQRVKSKTGEIFEFSFKTVSDIRKQFEEYNSKTKNAVDAFEHVVLPGIRSEASKQPHASTKGGKRRNFTKKHYTTKRLSSKNHPN